MRVKGYEADRTCYYLALRCVLCSAYDVVVYTVASSILFLGLDCSTEQHQFNSTLTSNPVYDVFPKTTTFQTSARPYIIDTPRANCLKFSNQTLGLGHVLWAEGLAQLSIS